MLKHHTSPILFVFVPEKLIERTGGGAHVVGREGHNRGYVQCNIGGDRIWNWNSLGGGSARVGAGGSCGVDESSRSCHGIRTSHGGDPDFELELCESRSSFDHE